MLRQMAVRAAMLSTALLFTIAGTIIIAARLVNVKPPDDPFASLAVLMPGQSFSAVENDFAYLCEPNISPTQHEVYCRVDTKNTGFTQLIVYVHNNVIDRLTIEGSRVTVGDMANRWGIDFRVKRQGDVRFIRWNGGHYATVLADVPFRYFLPVKTLSFTQAALP